MSVSHTESVTSGTVCLCLIQTVLRVALCVCVLYRQCYEWHCVFVSYTGSVMSGTVCLCILA